jgi:hypothetical protein
MIVFRENVLTAIRRLNKRISLISSIYIIWAIIMLFKDNNNYMMMFQLLLFIILASSFATSFNKITYEREINVQKIIKWTDLLSLASLAFISGYHVGYKIYNMFNGFEWINLLLSFFSFWTCAVIYKNNTAYRVGINNLSLFNDRESVDFEDGDWEGFLKQNMID